MTKALNAFKQRRGVRLVISGTMANLRPECRPS
jgi:hypothetical protein